MTGICSGHLLDLRSWSSPSMLALVPGQCTLQCSAGSHQNFHADEKHSHLNANLSARAAVAGDLTQQRWTKYNEDDITQAETMHSWHFAKSTQPICDSSLWERKFGRFLRSISASSRILERMGGSSQVPVLGLSVRATESCPQSQRKGQMASQGPTSSRTSA